MNADHGLGNMSEESAKENRTTQCNTQSSKGVRAWIIIIPRPVFFSLEKEVKRMATLAMCIIRAVRAHATVDIGLCVCTVEMARSEEIQRRQENRKGCRLR